MKIFAITAAVLLYAASCYAQGKVSAQIPDIGQKTGAVAAVQTASVSGNVKSVTLADAAKGTKAGISVADEKGQVVAFTVKPTTTIYGTDFKAIGLDKIKAEAAIKVKYVTKDGVNEAISLTELK
jgi:hypothetical protein